MLKPLVIASERVIAVTQNCLCKNNEKSCIKNEAGKTNMFTYMYMYIV